MVKDLPCNAGDAGLVGKLRFSDSVRQLSPCPN